MTSTNRATLPDMVYAEAVVQSSYGPSLLEATTPATSATVPQFYAEPATLQQAIDRLSAQGLTVLDVGRTSITVGAPPAVYERAFGTRLVPREVPTIKEFGQRTTATLIGSTDSYLPGGIEMKGPWQSLLAGVAINEPVYYFGSPAAQPPPSDVPYMQVPQDLVARLNAAPLHRMGLQGRGVRVAMIDTGWYEHPFFERQGWRAKVVLAPGSTDPELDANGHGTGESANLLALAPEINLTMVKADVAIGSKYRNVNSIAAFRTAMAQRPDIITCSWGTDLRGPTLSPYDRALAAVVADAVRRGIVVVFAAGNGHWGFPAQHPDVIAVGGVYQHLAGPLAPQLEASDYASGFVSRVYGRRRVPDVCGLVGQRPYGAYIQLPVPPGSVCDRACAEWADGTDASDGWAAFSGTSAAAPQVAGVCALLKQIDPGLSPQEMKTVLQRTARDVVQGRSNPMATGAAAGPGPDGATGHGLVDGARAAVALREMSGAAVVADGALPGMARGDPAVVRSVPQANLAPGALPGSQVSKSIDQPLIRRLAMYNDHPKLRENFNEVLMRLNEVLKTEFFDKDLIEDLELRISEDNFAQRKPETLANQTLVGLLRECFQKSTDRGSKSDRELNSKKVFRKHILAAKSLLENQQYKDESTKFLISVIESSEPKFSEIDAALGLSIADMAVEALGSLGNTSTGGESHSSISQEEGLLFRETGKYGVCRDDPKNSTEDLRRFFFTSHDGTITRPNLSLNACRIHMNGTD